MKKSIFAVYVLACFSSCSKPEEKPPVTEPYKCASCIATPEAKVEHDASSAGVYKGTLTGSTGTIALYLHHNGTETKALVVFDGQSATLTTTSLSSWMPGKPISNAAFTGVVNGKTVDAVFSVDSNGQNPQILVTIPGHNVIATVYKETSSAVVKNYEGTFAGDRKGTFNITFHENEYLISASNKLKPVKGTLILNKIDVLDEGLEIKGNMNSDEVSGTWRDTYNNIQGTWTGKRTM